MRPICRACRGNYEHAIRCCSETALPTIPLAKISAHAAWYQQESRLCALKAAAVKCVLLSKVHSKRCHILLL